MDYWQKRNLEAQQALQQKSEKQINKQLIKYYRSCMNSVIADFEATYDKLLAAKDNPTPADLYKLDRYWQMQAQLAEKLQKLGDRQAALLSTQFTNEYLNVYEALAIPGDENFARIDTQAAQQAINRIWVADGKSWSQRIWSNTDLLKQTLNEQLLHCVVTGKKTTELKKLLQERFGVSYSRAATLVRTETCHIQTEAAKQRYENYGIQQYEFLADTDEKTCSICGQLDGKRFYFTEMQPGVNAPPMHPNDRCAIIPVI